MLGEFKLKLQSLVLLYKSMKVSMAVSVAGRSLQVLYLSWGREDVTFQRMLFYSCDECLHSSPQQRYLNTWASSVCELCLQIIAHYIVYHVITSPLSFCALTFAPLFLCLSLSVCMWVHNREMLTHTHI